MNDQQQQKLKKNPQLHEWFKYKLNQMVYDRYCTKEDSSDPKLVSAGLKVYEAYGVYSDAKELISLSNKECFPGDSEETIKLRRAIFLDSAIFHLGSLMDLSRQVIWAYFSDLNNEQVIKGHFRTKDHQMGRRQKTGKPTSMEGYLKWVIESGRTGQDKKIESIYFGRSENKQEILAKAEELLDVIQSEPPTLKKLRKGYYNREKHRSALFYVGLSAPIGIQIGDGDSSKTIMPFGETFLEFEEVREMLEEACIEFENYFNKIIDTIFTDEYKLLAIDLPRVLEIFGISPNDIKLHVL